MVGAGGILAAVLSVLLLPSARGNTHGNYQSGAVAVRTDDPVVQQMAYFAAQELREQLRRVMGASQQNYASGGCLFKMEIEVTRDQGRTIERCRVHVLKQGSRYGMTESSCQVQMAAQSLNMKGPAGPRQASLQSRSKKSASSGAIRRPQSKQQMRLSGEAPRPGRLTGFRVSMGSSKNQGLGSLQQGNQKAGGAGRFGSLQQGNQKAGQQFGSLQQGNQKAGQRFGSLQQGNQKAGQRFGSLQQGNQKAGRQFGSLQQGNQKAGQRFGSLQQGNQKAGQRFGSLQQGNQKAGQRFGSLQQGNQKAGQQSGSLQQGNQKAGQRFGSLQQGNQKAGQRFGSLQQGNQKAGQQSGSLQQGNQKAGRPDFGRLQQGNQKGGGAGFGSLQQGNQKAGGPGFGSIQQGNQKAGVVGPPQDSGRSNGFGGRQILPASGLDTSFVPYGPSAGSSQGNQKAGGAGQGFGSLQQGNQKAGQGFGSLQQGNQKAGGAGRGFGSLQQGNQKAAGGGRPFGSLQQGNQKAGGAGRGFGSLQQGNQKAGGTGRGFGSLQQGNQKAGGQGFGSLQQGNQKAAGGGRSFGSLQQGNQKAGGAGRGFGSLQQGNQKAGGNSRGFGSLQQGNQKAGGQVFGSVQRGGKNAGGAQQGFGSVSQGSQKTGGARPNGGFGGYTSGFMGPILPASGAGSTVIYPSGQRQPQMKSGGAGRMTSQQAVFGPSQKNGRTSQPHSGYVEVVGLPPEVIQPQTFAAGYLLNSLTSQQPRQRYSYSYSYGNNNGKQSSRSSSYSYHYSYSYGDEPSIPTKDDYPMNEYGAAAFAVDRMNQMTSFDEMYVMGDLTSSKTQTPVPGTTTYDLQLTISPTACPRDHKAFASEMTARCPPVAGKAYDCKVRVTVQTHRDGKTQRSLDDSRCRQL